MDKFSRFCLLDAVLKDALMNAAAVAWRGDVCKALCESCWELGYIHCRCTRSRSCEMHRDYS